MLNSPVSLVPVPPKYILHLYVTACSTFRAVSKLPRYLSDKDYKDIILVGEERYLVIDCVDLIFMMMKWHVYRI